MKNLNLGQALGILSNLGVLLGILLLAYELAQNRQMMEAQTRNDLYDGLMNFLMFAADREFAELMSRSDAGEELDEIDRSVLGTRLTMQLRYFENLHYQYRAGLFDEDEFSAQLRRWQQLFTSKTRAENWCRVRDVYVADFAAEIDGLLTTYRCE